MVSGTRPAQLIYSEEAVKVLPLSSNLVISFHFAFLMACCK